MTAPAQHFRVSNAQNAREVLIFSEQKGPAGPTRPGGLRGRGAQTERQKGSVIGGKHPAETHGTLS